MANNDKQLERIESYLEGMLTQQERQEFEQQMETDPALALAYQQQLAILEAIEYQGNERLRPQLDQIYREEVLGERADTPIRKIRIFQRLAVAASLLLVLSVGLWLLLRAPAHERLFTAYYERPAATMFRDGQTSESEEALNAYQDDRFAEAIEQLEELDQSGTTTPEDLLVLGISYLEVDNYQEARSTLQRLEDNPNWLDAATWYLALIYLRQNQSEEAIPMFRALADGTIPTGPARQRKAGELLEQLEKN
jgi:tetratricopeptide (TPR) repeat protein